MMSREKSVKVGILMSLEGGILAEGVAKVLISPSPKGEQHETAPHWSTGLWEAPGVYCGPGSTLPLTEATKRLCAPRPARPKGLEQHFWSWRRCAESECGEASLWHARCEGGGIQYSVAIGLTPCRAVKRLLLVTFGGGGVKLIHTHGTELQLTFQGWINSTASHGCVVFWAKCVGVGWPPLQTMCPLKFRRIG
jgi:hypothetical protein